MKSPNGENLADEIKPTTPKKRKSSGVSRDKATNNHHVVPLGILVVLCTVYIMMAGLQSNYRYYFRPGVAAFDLPESHTQPDYSQAETKETESEYQDTACQKLDIFSRPTGGHPSENQTSKRPQAKQAKKGVGNGRQARMAKSLEGSRKKDVPKTKNNTAEPIIYLFALVFIYLLLKAASDINQHYKSNKMDKRLRRCSLQSYAQIHKQDRRASKAEESPIFRRRHILGDVRSVSVDRYKYTLSEEGGYVNMSSPRAPIPDYHRVTSPLVSSRPAIQPYPLRPSAGEPRFETRMNRRSSVPITINYQTVYVSSPHPPELVRRGSVASLAGQNPDPTALSDSKRRVRMINRH